MARETLGLVECRDRLRAVAERSGGPHLGAMVAEAKLLRATLVFASGAPLGATTDVLLPASVSIELLHLASLVHDDIIDEATERRGAPALHVTTGRNRALVLGDLLIVAAFDVLSEARAAVRCVETLSEGARLCCVGQLEELDSLGRPVSEERYLAIAARKTGSLFSAAASLGALASGATDHDLAALAELGTTLGTAYQVRDDLRDGGEDDDTRFRPTVATAARAGDAVSAALARVPPPCIADLRPLVDTMLGT